MKYFYDTEFIEDGKTIDLVSIGIVSEDGRSFYAISNEFDESRSDSWVRENVLSQIDKRTGISKMEIRNGIIDFVNPKLYGKPEFWAYYSAYDHVVLCQLFGKMINLPKGWPMHTNDIKQFCNAVGNPTLPSQLSTKHDALNDAFWCRDAYNFLVSVE